MAVLGADEAAAAGAGAAASEPESLLHAAREIEKIVAAATAVSFAARMIPPM